MRYKSQSSERARTLRKSQTKAEGLLWCLLRSKQFCGLKFRRQRPIGPLFADFACWSRHVVVELDGEHHDQVQKNGLRREHVLESQGWKVIRFTDDEVLKDAEAVARSIASQLGLPIAFRKRTSKRSGMMSENVPSNKLRKDENAAPLPARPLPRPTSPEGR